MATKPRHLKTPVQLWVADNRKRLGLTSDDLAKWTGVTTDTARGWESRGRPSQDALDELVRKFGVPAPDDMAGPPGDGGLAALIERQTVAMEKQAEALSALVALAQKADEDRDARLTELEAVVQALGERALGGSSGSPVRERTAG